MAPPTERLQQRPPRPLSPAQYGRLVSALQRVLEKGRQRIGEALGRALVQTYHALGTRLAAHDLDQRAAYGAATMQRLADDLAVDRRTLERAMLFARLYPAGPPALPLRWTHYRELILLPNAEQRGWYAKQCAALGWSASKLREAVREQQYRNRSTAEPPRLPASGRDQLRRPTEATYVYKATIERVVDGDTLIAIINVGFDMLRRQRLRLAAINAPEPDEPEGKEAFQLVVDELAQVDFVILKTIKLDLYGRFLAHVFYEPGAKDKHQVFAEGRYLNQQLVDAGLAEVL